MLRAVSSLALLVLLFVSPPLAPGAQEGGRYTTPLGIGLETWPYPHPVAFLPLEIEGQRLRMAYMDVRPAGAANAKTVVLFHGKNFSFAAFHASAADGNTPYLLFAPKPE